MPTILQINGKLRAAANLLQRTTETPSIRSLQHAMNQAGEAIAAIYRLPLHPTTKKLSDTYTRSRYSKFTDWLVIASTVNSEVNASHFYSHTILFYTAAQSRPGLDAIATLLNEAVPDPGLIWDDARILEICNKILKVDQWTDAELPQRVQHELETLIQQTHEDGGQYLQDVLSRVFTPAEQCPLTIENDLVWFRRLPIKLSRANRNLLALLIENFDSYVTYDEMDRKDPSKAMHRLARQLEDRGLILVFDVKDNVGYRVTGARLTSP